MAHKVETMAYAGETPWHGLGFKTHNKMTPKQMQGVSQTDWTVSKRPIHFDSKGKMIPIPGQFAIVRDSDESVLTMVGSTYKPVQNEQMFDFFTKFTKAGHMTMETAGSLAGGKYVWALARVGKDFKIGAGGKKPDNVAPFLLILSPHVHGKALVMQYTAIRVVCWNTLNMALGSMLKGSKHAFKMAHSSKWEVEKEEAEKVLGIAMAQTEEFKDASNLMAKTKAKKEDVEAFFKRVLRVELFPDKKKVPVMLPKFRAALEKAPGASLASAAGTWWGALNAVTYVVDHETGVTRDTALRGAWIGNHAQTKRRALSLALELAK